MSIRFFNKLHKLAHDDRGRLRSSAIITIGACAVLFAAAIAVLVVFPGQNERRRQLEAERAKKEEELDALMLQKEFLQELSSLDESREYLIRYLRETQGYIMNGDIRVDLADPDLVIPTPEPAAED